MAELKPDGLNRIYLGPENADGDRQIFAGGSPPKRIRVLARKKITVAIQATVTVAEEEPVLSGLTGARFSRFDPERAAEMGGTGRAAVLPEVEQPPGSPARKGSQPSSGLVIEPEPESRRLEVVAWNTRAPEKGHNVSHAERQFINWFNSQNQKWKQRVRSVGVVVFGRPICDVCASDIQTLSSRYPSIAFDWRSGDSSGKSQGEKSGNSNRKGKLRIWTPPAVHSRTPSAKNRESKVRRRNVQPMEESGAANRDWQFDI